MKLHRTIVILFLISCSFIDSTAQNSPNENLYQALGYIYGQDVTLNLIRSKYPDLSSSILLSESKFKNAFGDASINIEQELQLSQGTNFQAVKTKMKSQVKELVSKQQFNREMAIGFISEVEKRAEGKIQSPIRETLLTYEYINNPHLEILNGYKKIIRTKDHPKAKEVDFQIIVPESWSILEGDRPNVIKKAVSKNGKGLEMVILIVQDLPGIMKYQLTEKKINNLFSEEGLKDFLPEDGTFISGKRITVDNQPGGMLEFEQVSERLDLKIEMRGIIYVALWNNKMIHVQCYLGGLAGQVDTEKEFKKNFELFKQIGNSIIIQNQY